MLKEIGKYDDDFNYEKSLVNFRSARNQYIQVEPATDGLRGRSAATRRSQSLSRRKLRGLVKEFISPAHDDAVDDDTVKSDGEKIPQTFDQSMGVRKDDPALQAQLNAALVKAKPEIEAILKDEGIPVAVAAFLIREKGMLMQSRCQRPCPLSKLVDFHRHE